jgi:CubicO group peptidase (beta-lactamase class C family)
MLKAVNFFLTLVLLFSVVDVFAQPSTERFKAIDDYIEKNIPEWHVPGCVVAIVYKDSLVHTKSFGFRDAEKHLPVTTETVFRIGSLTKSFTALSCAILNDQKKLDLDKPLISYLPDFKMFNEELTNQTTTRDLLTHRTGLPRYDKLTDYNSFTKEDVFKRLQYLEPTQPFRSTFQYNNLMYVMAGLVLERRSGTPWSAFIEQNITIPLSMSNTHFDLRHYEATANHAIGYEFDDSLVEMNNPKDEKDEQNPAGSMSSNALDLSQYAMALIHDGKFNGKCTIPENAIRNCFTPYIFTAGLKYPEIFYESYGMGWFLNSYKGHLRINHEGNYDGFSASMCLMPQDTFAIIILTNLHQTSFTYVARNYIIDQMLGENITDWNTRLHQNAAKMESKESARDSILSTQKKEKKPDIELKTFTGTYTNPAFGKIILSVFNKQLHYDFNGLEFGVLLQLSKDSFTADLTYDDQMRFTFIHDADGKISKLALPLEEALHHDIEFVKQ